MSKTTIVLPFSLLKLGKCQQIQSDQADDHASDAASNIAGHLTVTSVPSVQC